MIKEKGFIYIEPSKPRNHIICLSIDYWLVAVHFPPRLRWTKCSLTKCSENIWRRYLAEASFTESLYIDEVRILRVRRAVERQEALLKHVHEAAPKSSQFFRRSPAHDLCSCDEQGPAELIFTRRLLFFCSIVSGHWNWMLDESLKDCRRCWRNSVRWNGNNPATIKWARRRGIRKSRFESFHLSRSSDRTSFSLSLSPRNRAYFLSSLLFSFIVF